MPNHLPAQPNRSVMEGLDVLFHLARKRRPAGVRQMARELDMTPSRVQRYLGTLAFLGLADRTPKRKYTVGPAIHVLSAIGLRGSGLVSRALEVLPPLSDTGCAVALGVLWRGTVSYLYFHAPGEPLAHALGRTEDYPASDSVIGLALLSHRSEEEILREFPLNGPIILDRVREVRRLGYARLERPNGETGLAIPVGDPAIAGLAITGPVQDETDLIKRLRQTAGELA